MGHAVHTTHIVAADFEAQHSRRWKLGQVLPSHRGERGRGTSDEGAVCLLPLQLPGAGGLWAGLRAAREGRINARIVAITKGKKQLC